MYKTTLLVLGPRMPFLTLLSQAWALFNLFPFFALTSVIAYYASGYSCTGSIPNPRKLRKIRLPESLKADRTIIDYRYDR